MIKICSVVDVDTSYENTLTISVRYSLVSVLSKKGPMNRYTVQSNALIGNRQTR